MSSHPVVTAMQPVPASSDELYDMAAHRLDPRELALVSDRCTQKRLADFVAGRVAARKAVSQLLRDVGSVSDFLVLREGNGPTGRPRVELTGRGAAPYVSISHADGLAIAAASFARIGVDLATIADQDRSFVEETFSAHELDEWAAWLNSPRTSAMTVTSAFAAKEAALKWLGTGFGQPLRSIEIVPAEKGTRDRTSSFPGQTTCFAACLIDCGLFSRRFLSGRHWHSEDRVSVEVRE
jgi:phosphopantetheinyl transferase